MARTGLRIAFGAVLAALLVGEANAQTLSLPGGQIYRPGPDFASDVLQDPWDFANAEDVAPDADQLLGWVSPVPETVRTVGTGESFISGGRFRGVPGMDSNVTLLYRADANALNPGRSGISSPIDPAKYRKLAVKMRVTGAPVEEQLITYWFHRSLLEGDWLNSGAAAGAPLLVPPGDSEQIYVVDLATAPFLYPACGGAGCTGVPMPYTGSSTIRGLRLDPLNGPAEGVEIDWVRLTAGNGQADAAMMPVALAGCAAFQSLQVVETASGVATVIGDSTGTNTSRSFNYGILPPGAYTVRAACSNGTTPAVAFQIDAPPVVTVTDPDERGDPATDYALLARGGDAWDFEQLTDMARTFNVATTGGACAALPCGIVPTERPGGTGQMLRVTSANAVGDPGLEFLNGPALPLNSRRHRLLTFSMRHRRPYVLNPVIGAVLRVLWSTEEIASGYNFTPSQDMRVWPGFHTYTLDLATLTTTNGGIETECLACPTTPWTSRGIRHLRIDPHEYGDAPTATEIDDVTLTAPDEVALGQQFTIRYGFTDANAVGSTYTARIVLEQWPSRTGRIVVATLPNIGPGARTYLFNPQAAGVAAGEYAVAVEIDEAKAGVSQVVTSRSYGSGMLVVSNPGATSPRVSVTAPGAGATLPQAFTIAGCAFDDGTTTGNINVDDLTVTAVAGPGVTGQPQGTVIALGGGGMRGTTRFAPLGTAVTCPSVSNPASPYRNSGFRVEDVALEPGPWTLRVAARSTLSGAYVPMADLPFTIGNQLSPPVNFQATASGNLVTVSWQAPAGGPAISGYVLEMDMTPAFAPPPYAVPVASAGIYSGALPSGRYYFRVASIAAAGGTRALSATRVVDVNLPQAPGAPVLTVTLPAPNVVAMAWTPGPGGTPQGYTLYVGSSPGASDLGVHPLGLATSVAGPLLPGTFFLRVVASNTAGSAASNDVRVPMEAPGTPTMHVAGVHDGIVTLSWSPGATGGIPAGYVLRVRAPGSDALLVNTPVTGTSLSGPAPPGTYHVSIVATGALGSSAESNRVVVVVP